MNNSYEDDRVAVIRLRELNTDGGSRVANFSEGKESTETVIARRSRLKMMKNPRHVRKELKKHLNSKPHTMLNQNVNKKGKERDLITNFSLLVSGSLVSLLTFSIYTHESHQSTRDRLISPFFIAPARSQTSHNCF